MGHPRKGVLGSGAKPYGWLRFAIDLINCEASDAVSDHRLLALSADTKSSLFQPLARR